MKIIHTKNAPNPVGPYVQAINIGNIIFISGQIGICPETNKIPDGIEQQTYQTLKNIKTIIKKSGFSVKNIIKTTIFLTNINDIHTVNMIYQNFFNINNATFPTRSCIEVNNLPKYANIEIEAIATTQKNQ